MPETVSDFGSIVQDSREGSLGCGTRRVGLTIKSRDPKGPKVRLSPQICSFITFRKVLSLGFILAALGSVVGKGGSSSSISKATFGIHNRENPFPSSPTPTHPAKSIPKTFQIFGQWSKTHAKVVWGGTKGWGG
ncbi:hypothetical protein CEXT_550861 [Caerostris extrusa]|uniref:Uncharacterized protein n=1 Tax=Caerostris extrusa TaxID=172846 RepID=A0AAV4NU43_CAEEX|nr:hypothetical protein CEXT_550861 [Caerostris extrusa]